MIAAGLDIAGTINGHPAVGNGLLLTGASGQPEESLSLKIAQTAPGDYGSITIVADSQLAEGTSVLMNLQSFLNGIRDPLFGPMHHSTDPLNWSIKAINDQISDYLDRLEVRRAMLTAEFNKADQALAQIAELNDEIRVAQGPNSEDQFILRDNRQQLLEQLSGLIDLSYYETESGGVTVTTGHGGVLVLENQAHSLGVAPRSGNSFSGVFLDGADITATLKSGRIGGLIDLRDNKITGYLNSLDDLAAAIITRVNKRHALGSDLNGSAGSDFFSPLSPSNPGTNSGAARTMKVALTDPREIAAAASGGGPGNNLNSKLLASIIDETITPSSRTTVGHLYADLIYRIGSDRREQKKAQKLKTSVMPSRELILTKKQ
jgi:flagellar hook-associated protein FlgK